MTAEVTHVPQGFRSFWETETFLQLSRSEVTRTFGSSHHSRDLYFKSDEQIISETCCALGYCLRTSGEWEPKLIFPLVSVYFSAMPLCIHYGLASLQIIPP